MATIEHGDLTIESNHETAEAMRAAMVPVQAKKPAAADAAAAENAPPDEDGQGDGGAADGAAVAAGGQAPKARNRRDDPRKAVETAVGKQRTAERERDEAKAESKRLADELAAAKKPAVAAPAGGTPPAAADDPNRPITQAEWKRYKAMPGAPKADDFEDHDDFVAAMSLFVTDTRWAEHQETLEADNFEKSRRETWKGRMDTFKGKHPERFQKIDPNTPANQQMKDIIADSEIGPEMLEHLSNHQTLAQRISTLHPAEVAREMGKIEGQLSAKPAASSGTAVPPVISSAKRPVQPVGGSQKQVSDDDADEEDLPIEEFISRGNKREGRPTLRP